MKNIPILGKFLTIIAVFGAFAIGVAFYSTGEMRGIDVAYTALADHQERAALRIAQSTRAMNSAHAAIADLLISTSEADNRMAAAEFSSQRERMNKFFDEAQAALPANARIAQLKGEAIKVLDVDCGTALREGAAVSTPAGVLQAQKDYLSGCSSKFAAIIADGKAITDELAVDADKGDDALTVRTNTTIAVTYGVIVGGLALVVALAFFGVKAWVVAPILNMSRTMGVIAGGDTDVDIPCRFRKDELGKMGIALESFRVAAIDKRNLEADAAGQGRLAEAEREKGEQQRAQRAREQAQVVDGVASGLAKLASGDLMFRLETAFSNDYESLRKDFNAAMGKLAETMTVVSTNAAAIHSGTGEISTAADDLSRRTEQQAASLEQTAAALDEITSTVRKTADGAIHAREVVGSAKSDAEKSGAVVREAVSAMSGIEKSSHQIGQIISVIDEIAFQTNLLALNAGVEAARAGDAGRGFAVVASEVRALAQRSAEAAKEIKALISASSQQVSAGVSLVGEAGRALERIAVQVTEINGVVGEIAASAQEQATALNQVNTAVNQMDQVTQQNAAMVEETTAASHSLAHEAQELSRLISRFSVGGAASGEVPRRPAPAPARATRTVMKAVGSGGAARKPEAAADEGWEDF